MSAAGEAVDDMYRVATCFPVVSITVILPIFHVEPGVLVPQQQPSTIYRHEDLRSPRVLLSHVGIGRKYPYSSNLSDTDTSHRA